MSNAEKLNHEFGFEFNPDHKFSFLTNPQERQQILHRMVRLVGRMVDSRANTVVLCDRGARPLAALSKVLWMTMTDQPLPSFVFVNPSTKNRFDFDAEKIPDETISGLKTRIHLENPNTRFKYGGARVYVVDELKTSGGTAKYVSEIISRTFPETVSTVKCDWAEVPRPWNDNTEAIGARNISGELYSKTLDTPRARALEYDLVQLALNYQFQISLN